MGNCCGTDKYPKGKGQKLGSVPSQPTEGNGHRLGNATESVPMQTLNTKSDVPKPEPIANPFPSSSSPGSADRQKILEATEKRLQESQNRGALKGQGKLSKKLQEEKGKSLVDYAKEDLEKKQAEDNMQWRAD